METLAGLQAAAASKSLWARLVRATDERLLPARATSSLSAFRELIANLSEVARHEPVSITLGRMLDQTGYLQELRDERSEEADGRIANLMELVAAARDYELRQPEASLAGFVDRLSLLSEVDEEQGSADARISLMTLHTAKGLEFPMVVIGGVGGRALPPLSLQRRRRAARGGAPLVLRRNDQGPIAADSHQRCAAPRVR